jgi:capsular polysaccharide biosynthesis protein
MQNVLLLFTNCFTDFKQKPLAAMITFKPVIRNVRADGYAAVYIRVTKDRESDYVKTTYVARRQQLSGKNIKDYTLVAKVSTIIDKYVTRLNFEDTELWTLREVINFLMQENSQISFNDFFREHTGKMLNDRRNSQYRNYNSAFKLIGKSIYAFLVVKNVINRANQYTHFSLSIGKSI